MEISVPRDRDGSFEPQAIPKCTKDLSGIEDKVLSMYARGMSQRDIADIIEDIYGFSISHVKADIEEIEREIEAMMKEEEELIKEMVEIPGIRESSVRVIIAEIGTEMEKFPDKEQIVSWVGLCPGKNESGGKKTAEDNERE